VVRVVFLTSGEHGGHGRPPEETGPLREREAHVACRILGLQHFEFWRVPDKGVRVTKALTERLASVIRQRRADVIYVPHDQEMNADHRAAARLVRNAVRMVQSDGASPTVLMYEVWTPLQGMDVIVDISEHIDKKLEAIRAYKCQCDVLRFDDAIAGLNRYRGEMHSWPGGPYAEIFLEMRV